MADNVCPIGHLEGMRTLHLIILALAPTLAAAPNTASAQPLEPLRGQIETRVNAWKTCPRPSVVRAKPSGTDVLGLVTLAKACLETVRGKAGDSEADVAALKADFAAKCADLPNQIKALSARPDPCATRPVPRLVAPSAVDVVNLFRAVSRHVAIATPTEAVEIALAGMQTAQDFARGGPLIDNMIGVAAYDMVHGALTPRISSLPKPALARLSKGLGALLAAEPAYADMIANEADFIIAFRLAPSMLGPKWLPADVRRVPMKIEATAQLGLLRLWARLDGFGHYIRNHCGAKATVGVCELALGPAGRRFGTGEKNDPLTGASSRFTRYLRKLATRRAAMAALRAQIKVAQGGICPPRDIAVPGVDGTLRVERGKEGWLLESPPTLGDIRAPYAQISCTP